MTQDIEFQSRMQQLDGLLEQVSSIADAAARAKTEQIIQGLMDFHGAALANVVEAFSQSGEAGAHILRKLADDDLAASMLLLYGLHPDDLSARVNTALEKARPYLASHGGNVELLGISDDGIVRLAMKGSCHSCPSSAVTLKTTIEQAIYQRAPEITAIQIHEEPAAESNHASGFVPIEALLANIVRNPVAQGVPA
jgi:Fe-S cluster biogenesis protein NfuA